MATTTTHVVDRRPGWGPWIATATLLAALAATQVGPDLLAEPSLVADPTRVAEAMAASTPVTSLPPVAVPDPLDWPGRPAGLLAGSHLAVLRHHAIDVVDLDTGVVTRHRLREIERFFPGVADDVPEQVARGERPGGVPVPVSLGDGSSMRVGSGDGWSVRASECGLGACHMTVVEQDTSRDVDLDLYALATPLTAAYAPSTGFVATFVETRQGDRVALVVLDREGLRHFTQTRPVVGGGSGLLAWNDDGTVLFHTYRGDSTLRAFSPDHPFDDPWLTAELRLGTAIALRVMPPVADQRSLAP